MNTWCLTTKSVRAIHVELLGPDGEWRSIAKVHVETWPSEFDRLLALVNDFLLIKPETPALAGEPKKPRAGQRRRTERKK